MVTVENRANGKISEFTQEEWDKVKKDPNWTGVFIEKKAAKVPTEIQGSTNQNKAKNDAKAGEKTTGDDNK